MCCNIRPSKAGCREEFAILVQRLSISKASFNPGKHPVTIRAVSQRGPHTHTHSLSRRFHQSPYIHSKASVIHCVVLLSLSWMRGSCQATKHSKAFLLISCLSSGFQACQTRQWICSKLPAVWDGWCEWKKRTRGFHFPQGMYKSPPAKRVVRWPAHSRIRIIEISLLTNYSKSVALGWIVWR